MVAPLYPGILSCPCVCGVVHCSEEWPNYPWYTCVWNFSQRNGGYNFLLDSGGPLSRIGSSWLRGPVADSADYGYRCINVDRAGAFLYGADLRGTVDGCDDRFAGDVHRYFLSVAIFRLEIDHP